ncbi:hypothetical protein [Amycolatopsis sp. lyj-346]|uniref:hypothetical protein n=1 Tax=Amycolatopsis sp. lyj-346 TaxID=2789289 RepID=UPI00397B5499
MPEKNTAMPIASTGVVQAAVPGTASRWKIRRLEVDTIRGMWVPRQQTTRLAPATSRLSRTRD